MAQMVGGGVSNYAPNSVAHNEVKGLLTEIFELLNIPAPTLSQKQPMGAEPTHTAEETLRGVAI